MLNRSLSVLFACLALLAAVLVVVPAAAGSPLPTPSLTLRAPSSLWLGDTVSLRVSVDPALAGETVSIEQETTGTWQPVAQGVLDAQSRVSVRWKPAAFGFVRLRASLAAGASHDAGVSPVRRVVVNRPNAHHVPYKFAHYIVIVVHEYRLYYYEHGRMVRAFNVALGRPGFHTPLGHFHILAKRKPGGGPLGSCAMFYRWQGGIAIHGTNEPWLLHRFPRPFSHGCARMYNTQALWLYYRCPRGTPIHNLS